MRRAISGEWFGTLVAWKSIIVSGCLPNDLGPLLSLEQPDGQDMTDPDVVGPTLKTITGSAKNSTKSTLEVWRAS